MEIENLQIDDKVDKPSSSESNKMSRGPNHPGNRQDNRSREEIKMERRAKAAEAKTRKGRCSFSHFVCFDD